MNIFKVKLSFNGKRWHQRNMVNKLIFILYLQSFFYQCFNFRQKIEAFCLKHIIKIFVGLCEPQYLDNLFNRRVNKKAQLSLIFFGDCNNKPFEEIIIFSEKGHNH